MNLLQTLLIQVSLIIILIPIQAQAQDARSKEHTDEKLKTAAIEMIDAAQYCALITLDEKNTPMVRIMDPFPPEADFTVWFGTNAKSRKVQHIKLNPKVSLYYQDADTSGYVVIHGHAELVNDEKEKQQRWKSAWEAFYPNNREDYLLIKVSPEWMEVLSTTRGIIGDKNTWEIPVVRLDP